MTLPCRLSQPADFLSDRSVLFLKGVSMGAFFQHLGNILYWSALCVAGILLFELPATIFAYLGFARLTSDSEALTSVFICTALACLSWVVGKVLRYAVTGT
jgi:hypothetical protein